MQHDEVLEDLVRQVADCVDTFQIEECGPEPLSPSATRLMIKAAEHLEVYACQLRRDWAAGL